MNRRFCAATAVSLLYAGKPSVATAMSGRFFSRLRIGGSWYNLFHSRGVIVIKWRDTAWKRILTDCPQSAIEYLMPDLAADMDTTGKIEAIPGEELFSKGSDSDKHMREPDVVIEIPMLDGETGNVALFAEQQHDPNADIPLRVFETYIRLREKKRLKTTCIVIYTGSAPNVNMFSESCYGCEVSMKYRTYYLPEKTPDELRADNRPFARVMLAARLSLDAGDDVKSREKYAMEIMKATTEQDYDYEQKPFILGFAERIFRLNDPRISDNVKEVYKMQTIPLEEYRKQVYRETERLEAIEEEKHETARRMLADGMAPELVAKYTRQNVEEVNALRE